MRVVFISAMLFFCCQQTLYAQGRISMQQPTVLKGAFSYFMTDQLDNVFALGRAGQLKKFNANMDSMGVFNDVRRYGKLHSISAENPLRSLLYFKEYKIILVLDRLMQVVNKIDLRQAGIFQAPAVAQGYDNSIWVFDEQESKLKKMDANGKLMFETADLRLVLDESLVPTALFDAGGYVYLYDSKKGLFVFDYYGAMKNKIAILGWKYIQPMGKSIIGLKHGKVLVYVPGEIDIKEFELPPIIASADQVQLRSNAIYVLDAEGISRFEWAK